MAFDWITNLSSAFSNAAPQTQWEKDRDRLFAATQKNDTKTIEELTTAYADEFADWKSSGGSLLQVAQKKGSLDAFKLLVERGAKIDQDYGDGWTPFLTAVRDNQKSFINYLIEQNVDLNAQGYMGRSSGGAYAFYATPLHLCIQRGDKEAVTQLLAHGANPGVTVLMPKSDYNNTNAEGFATLRKQFVIADIVKRAPKIRAEFLAQQAQAAAAPPVPAVPAAATSSKISIMNPLQIKKASGWKDIFR